MSLDLNEKRRVLNLKLSYNNLSRRTKQWLATNTRTKVWIFLFTVILWLFVILNNRYSYTFTAKIETRNIDPTKTLMEKLPVRLQASFSGKGIDLFYLLVSRQKSFKFIVDCQSIKRYYDFPLNEYFSNNPEKVIIPRGANVRLEHVTWPETLHVVLDDLLNIKLPVKPMLEMQLAPGYILIDSMTVNPDSVSISGPRTFIQQFKEIHTEKLVMKNISSSIDKYLLLDFIPKSNIKLDVKSVRCQQEVDQLGERELKNISVMVVNLGPNQKAEVIPASAAITVSGGIEVLKAIQPDDIKIVFDMKKDWHPSESFYSPTVEIPNNILSWRNLTPEKFEIRIIRERQP